MKNSNAKIQAQQYVVALHLPLWDSLQQPSNSHPLGQYLQTTRRSLQQELIDCLSLLKKPVCLGILTPDGEKSVFVSGQSRH